MPNNLYIFAVGGTGARVLRSFTMLLASGQKKLKGWDIYPVILDYDNTNGDTEIATRCIEKYNEIHNIVWKKDDSDKNHFDGFFKSNLCPLQSSSNNSSFQLVYAPKGNNTYKEYIGYDQLGKDTVNSRILKKNIDTNATKMLLESLYNTDPVSDDAEMNLHMDVGFKGNPNIGSVVFHDIDNECDEFKTFLKQVSPNDRVIVIGSLYGGTGSSGIPEIIRKIRKYQKGSIPIAAVLMMPYFAPKQKDGGTIRSEIFNSKTKAAINYYIDSGMIDVSSLGKYEGGMIDYIYFIGDSELTELPYCDGGPCQKNPANIVEFISALAIIHFSQCENDDKGSYKFGVNPCIIGDINSKKELLCKDLTGSEFVRDAMTRLVQFTIALKYYMFYLQKGGFGKYINRPPSFYTPYFGDTNSDMKKLMKGLSNFWDAYKCWLDQLSNKNKKPEDGNKHSLTLFNTDDNMVVMAGGKEIKIDKDEISTIINAKIKEFETGGMKDLDKPKEFVFLYGLYMASIDKKVYSKILNAALS